MDQLKTTPISSWALPPERIAIERDEIHIWRAALNLKAPRVQELERLLAPEERMRAGQYYFQKDRHEFIVARGLLRRILGSYLEIEPSRLAFCYSAKGKPALDRKSGGDDLRFNVTHSHGLALYAIVCGREVGIDLECFSSDFAAQQLAEQFFAPGEAAFLRAHPLPRQQEAFFIYWTLKEAYLKARGEGLSLPLNQFEVVLSPEGRAKVFGPDSQTQGRSRWSLWRLAPAPRYVAALAVAGDDGRLRYWEWPEAQRFLHSTSSRLFIQ